MFFCTNFFVISVIFIAKANFFRRSKEICRSPRIGLTLRKSNTDRTLDHKKSRYASRSLYIPSLYMHQNTWSSLYFFSTKFLYKSKITLFNSLFFFKKKVKNVVLSTQLYILRESNLIQCFVKLG